MGGNKTEGDFNTERHSPGWKAQLSGGTRENLGGKKDRGQKQEGNRGNRVWGQGLHVNGDGKAKKRGQGDSHGKETGLVSGKRNTRIFLG